MREDEAGLPEERVKRALGRLGVDRASAPDVPSAITARIAAALRSASPPPAHARSPGRPRLIALVVGIAALLAAAAVGLAILLHTGQAPRFPSGPTAETMTVSPTPADTPTPVVTRP
jgi:hypothetical protein